jgi:hypothetical protein
MAKFQLTISADYVPTWGVYEGLREAVQNALDGAQDGYAMEVEPPTAANPVLRIRNKGVTLDRSIWLMGTTSKADGDYRGCYGEGLKLGALALTRANRTVAFANGEEDWRVKLEPAKAFEGKPVVTVYTVKRKQPTQDFTISISCSPKEWESARLGFLALLSSPPKSHDSYDGRLLLDPAFAGRLYVKGIFVQHKEDLAYGYDFKHARVDRDRRMINDFDLGWHCSAMWSSAIVDPNCSEVDAPMVLDFLASNSEDARSFKVRGPSAAAMAAVEAAWIARHGEDSIPVCSREGLNAAGHLGLHGVIASEATAHFFHGSEKLDLQEAAKHRRLTTTRTYLPGEFEDVEQCNLLCCLKLADRAIASGAVPGITTGLEHRVEIVDFSGDTTLGMYSAGEIPGRSIIRLARRILSDFTKTFEVLIHEVAHDAGPDGSVQHQRAESALHSTIALHLLQGRHPCPPHLVPGSTASADLELLRRLRLEPTLGYPSGVAPHDELPPINDC